MASTSGKNISDGQVNGRKGPQLARSTSLRTPKIRGNVAARLETSQRQVTAREDGTATSKTPNGNETQQDGTGPSQSHSFALRSHARAQSTVSSSTPTEQGSASAMRASSGPSTRLNRTSSLTSKATSDSSRTGSSFKRPPPSSWRPAQAPLAPTRAQDRPAQTSQHAQAQDSTSSKPGFSTYQQEFAVPKSHSRSFSRASSTSTTSTPRKTNPTTLTASMTNRAASSPVKSDQTPAPSTTAVPLSTRLPLLHASLLHQAAAPSLRALTASARASLERRHRAVQNLYTTVLTLRRSARQSRNLLALHTWSGGNVASLVRKLSVLVGVLSELCVLTEPGERGTDDDSKAPGETSEMTRSRREQGRYAACVAGFEAWMGWVQEAWVARDAASQVAAETDVGADNSAISVQIEGLGDGIKAEMRALGHTLNGLAVKLEDLRAVPFVAIAGAGPASSPSKRGAPATPRGQDLGDTEGAGGTDATDTLGGLPEQTPTPAVLLQYALQLTHGMQEEVQVMREIEFEVVVGEKAWMEQELRRVSEEVGGGWG